MKNNFIFLILRLTILSAVFCLTACTAEQIKDLADQISGNEANFSGSYALDDGSGLTNTYISFSKGRLYEYRRTDKVVLAENYIWGTKATDFSLARAGEYSISSGILYCNGVPSGKIQITETQMVLDGQVYQKIIALKEDRYSVIAVGEYPGSYSYQKADVQIPVSVNKTIPSGKFTAQKSVSWITRCEVKDGMLCLSLDENNSGYYRTGSVVVSYTGAANVTVTIYQLYTSSAIVCAPSSQEVGYRGGNHSLLISITSPREGTALQISNQYDWITSISPAWITEVQSGGNVINYNISENLSINPRSGSLSIKYGSYASRTFSITQEGAPVQSLTLDRAGLAMSVGTSQTLYATVKPSDAALSWSSTNTAVATVTQSGLVKAIGNGTSTIVVQSSDGKKSATCLVQVTTPVTGVSLNKSSLNLVFAQSETLIATVSPSTASNKNVIWSSSNASVATVNQSGLVTALSDGLTVISVKTEDGNKITSCNLIVNSIDLSSGKTANCYVVSAPGTYNFKTVKGNSSTSVGTIASAEVLWESFGTSETPSKGDIIHKVNCSAGSGSNPGVIMFSTPSVLKNGNAVIAAKDASGNILWSWHIWVCNGYNPSSTAQTYYNNAGTMMDRNLGATSATPGDVGALGLMYQWGRKDPFLGSSGISSDTQAVSTISWPSAITSNASCGTINYSIQHPTTFIINNDVNYDWYYSDKYTTDNTRWQSTKTIHDPCPPGWHVPTNDNNGVWAKALGSSSAISYLWNEVSRGMNFSGKFGSSATIWYPAAGSLHRLGSGLNIVGSSGYWWSCSPIQCRAYSLHVDGENVSILGENNRASGNSVRCVQE